MILDQIFSANKYFCCTKMFFSAKNIILQKNDYFNQKIFFNPKFMFRSTKIFFGQIWMNIEINGKLLKILLKDLHSCRPKLLFFYFFIKKQFKFHEKATHTIKTCTKRHFWDTCGNSNWSKWGCWPKRLSFFLFWTKKKSIPKTTVLFYYE